MRGSFDAPQTVAVFQVQPYRLMGDLIEKIRNYLPKSLNSVSIPDRPKSITIFLIVDRCTELPDVMDTGSHESNTRRRTSAERRLQTSGEKGAICVYSSFIDFFFIIEIHLTYNAV